MFEKWLIPGLRKGRYKSLGHFVELEYKEVLKIFDRSKGTKSLLEEAPRDRLG